MKKILTLLLIIVALFSLTACGGGEGDSAKYSETYSYNDNLHWRNQINGSGRADVGEHVNDRGKCSVCDYYFDASEFLTYAKVNYDGSSYYAVYAYKGDVRGAYTHIEIPAYYQGANDSSPIPVIAINAYVFSPTKNLGIESLRSVKMNEGLKFIGNGAFSNTSLVEVVVPDSVTGGINGISGVSFDDEGNQLTTGRFTYWPSATQGLYNVFGGCINLKRAVIGNGVRKLEGYLFSSCKNLEEVILGDSVDTIIQRAFYECKALKQIVLPALLTSIPEASIYVSNLGKYQALTRLFDYADVVYMKMTREQYKKLSIRKVLREESTGYPLDTNGNPVNIDETSYPYPSYGIVEGWCGMADLYFAGEWDYDENGNPTPNVK